MPPSIPRQPELIVALDFPHARALQAGLDALPAAVTFGKVGLELFIAEGAAALRPLADRRMRLFLDLKLHDIPRTVAQAVRSAARHGATLMTVHACGGRDMLRAAAEAARDLGPDAPKLIAVTTLTSLNQADLADLGITRTLAEQALRLGEMALSSGIDGLVTSVHEAAELRRRFGPDPILVTPGIRPAGAEVGDQKRVATPAAAVRAGADFLVVGRPITEASDPAAAVMSLLKEMDSARTTP
jgi:orotidine-5'-phosphate decarboxylase